jgi:hypothetical protein
MAFLYTNSDNKTDSGALELDGAAFITSADVGGTTFVFAAGAVDNGVSVFSLSRSGVLTNTDNVTDGGSLNLVGVSGLTTITSSGLTYLVAAGAGDNGLSVFRVSTAGALTSVANVADTGSLFLAGVSRVASATVGGNAYVFASGSSESGISAFRVEATGALTSVGNVADNGTYELAGVRGLTTAVVGGNTLLFAAGFSDDGVSVFQVGSDGSLTHRSSVTDDATYKLDGASDVTTAVVNGVTYLFAAGAVDSGVSVFSVSSGGVLTYVTSVADSAGLRLAGASSVAATSFGASTYLTVGGTESGVSMFKVNAGGTLTLVDNIDDGGSRELSGASTVHSASVGGVNYVIAGGSSDDGVSVLGVQNSGQLWGTTEGGTGATPGADTRLFYINSDGTGQTTLVDNSGSMKFATQYTADMGVDTAAGFYFAVVNTDDGDTATLVRGQIGSTAAPTVVLTSSDLGANSVVNSIEVDAVNRKIYVGVFDGATADPAASGIRVWDYGTNGALTGGAYLTKGSTDDRPTIGGFDFFNPQDFALDSSAGRLFYSERLDEYTTGLYRINLSSPNNATRLVAGQFGEPDPSTGPPNGFIGDVEVDEAKGVIYFTTFSQHPFGGVNYQAGQNALWLLSETAASNASATQVTLVGMPGGNHFYPGDMTFDAVNRQLYIESEEGESSNADDVIYVFQLDTAGTTATLINTLSPSPLLSQTNANIEGLTFASLPVLTLSGTSSAATEQGSEVNLLTGQPTITDSDGGYLTGATVQVAGGKFSSNEASTSDDHLGIGASKQITGTISGTSISVTWDATTEILTLSGYDTIAHYKTALNSVVFWSTGDNPTNYGLNTNRTIAWTVNDGTNAPGGGVNSGATILTLTGVNDAPVNATPDAISVAENSPGVAITSLQISDVDANALVQTMSVTLSATKGVMTLLTNVVGGLTAGEITGNGTASVVISGTLSEINTTLAASNGLKYVPNTNASGSDTLTVLTSDGGASDTDNYGITIAATNDAPVVPATATTVGATEQTAAVLLGSLVVSDADLGARNSGSGDFAGASFTVQRGAANAADTFAFNTSGAAFTVSGANLQAGGLTIGTFTATGGVLTISFTSSGATATTALVNDVLNHITYTNSSDNPPASVTLNYTLNDGGGQGAGGALSGNGAVIVNLTAVNDPHTGGASVTGAAAEDQVLTAVSTLADPDGLGTLHYQWQHDVGGGYVNVGADQATYTLGDGDIGGVVRVVIYYTDNGGTVESATSAATAAIAASNDAPTGGVSVTGTTTEDQVVTADTSTLADSDGLGTLNYDWQRNTGSGYVSIGAANQATYTLGDADVGALLRVVVSYTDGQGFANSVTSPGTAAIAGVNDPHTGGASITGSAAEDQVLTAVSTVADVDGLGTLHYQWQHDVGGGYVNVGADQATYTLGDGDIGGVVRVVIYYTDNGGTVESATSAATTAVTATNDAPTGGVSVTGTTTEDQVVTADTSTLADSDGLGTLNYDWQRNTGSGYVSIGAANQATYTLGDADVGALLRVVVSYTDGQGFANSVTSAGTAAIAGVNDPHTGGASVTGTATENQVLTAVSTLADVDGLGTLHYQWQHDVGGGYVNVGADQATYTLGNADVGGLVRVVISYTDGQGFAESATSAATAAVANINDAPTGAVTVSGATTENQVLTAVTTTLADADGLGTLTYQWQRSNGAGYDNVGTNAATYTLGDADVGKAIRVQVSYTDNHGAAEALTSAATANVAAVNDPHTGGASVTGTATEDQVLTAVSTLADVDGLGTLHYQWQRDTGSGYASTGAADQATYTLGDADVGGTVRVVVSYTDGQGFAESATSAATATIANVNDLPTGTVVIAGTATDGQTLTAGNTLADADGLGTIHYQWKAGGADIVGETTATLALTSADIGKVISVVASYTDLHGTAETVASTTVTVADSTPPTTTTGTVIDGAPVEVTKTTNADGTVTQTTTIATVTTAATDQTADIPLFTEGGQSLLSVSAPVGFSLTVTGNDKPEPAGSSFNNLITAIVAAGGNNSQTGAGGDFLSTLTTDSRILVQSVTPTVSPGAPANVPLTFTGGPATDGVFTALVLDVTKLPSGTVINLQNIDFITIVGAVRVGGGEGSQVVFGDSADQYIVLGADDDVLHGGGGNDTVGSKGGNDKLYGDAGDDTLFGGDGNDLMDGGAGADTVLMGGNLKDYVFYHTANGLQSASFEGEDTMVNVETLKMVDGSTVTDLNRLVAGTTSVAVMTYEFFTGKTPTAAGLQYLLHAPDTVNANDLSDAYYTKFNVDNRYINFAVNLTSPQGQAHAWFETNYGSLNVEQTVTKAYQEIFGVALTTDKMQHLLYDQVGANMTRLHYFELFAGSAEGAKAGLIGWLLSAAVLENTGRYAAANTAFLNDFADGDAKLNVDLVGVYGDGHPWGT